MKPPLPTPGRGKKAETKKSPSATGRETVFRARKGAHGLVQEGSYLLFPSQEMPALPPSDRDVRGRLGPWGRGRAWKAGGIGKSTEPGNR